jgi:hypothetical protein
MQLGRPQTCGRPTTMHGTRSKVVMWQTSAMGRVPCNRHRRGRQRIPTRCCRGRCRLNIRPLCRHPKVAIHSRCVRRWVLFQAWNKCHCISFHLWNLDRTQSGMPHKSHSGYQTYQCHNHDMLFWHRCAILPLRIRHSLFCLCSLDKNHPGMLNKHLSFGQMCQHRTYHISHCRLRTTNQLDNRCNCGLFLCHQSTLHLNKIYT